MTSRLAIALAGMTILVSSLFAQEAAKAPAEAQENPELEREIAYVEALVGNGYPDIADPIIVATKKKFPASEARFFAIEVRAMLALGKFEDAEKKIAALPDRKGTKYWAARLEVANNYFGRGQKKECMQIYDGFFKVFQKPPADIRKFYNQACYAYGQLLVGDKQYAKAAQRYAALLEQLKVGDDMWCNLACETVDIYLKLLDSSKKDPKQAKARDGWIAAATKIADQLLWQLEKPVFFGRAVSMKAHIEQMKGDVSRAAELIDEYKPQLSELHEQILQFDPDGRQGLLKQSPLPECLFLQAQMLFDAAKEEYAKSKRDDEKVKTYMFGPKSAGKRQTAKGAFAMAQGVFLNYETSSWAPQAGELAEEIKVFAEQKYKAKIKTKVTKEQIAKVRAAQFRNADEKFAGEQYQEAIDAYMAVLAKYPELEESIPAVEHVASAYVDLTLQTKDKALKAEYRDNADAIEGYLAERFADFSGKNKVIMTLAGDAVVRLAAKESEYRNAARADRLYKLFCLNYRNHSSAANTAAAKGMECQKAERWEDAIGFWDILATVYTNAPAYATSLMQLSVCYGKLGNREKEIEYISKYVGVETVKIRQLQAKMQLAQMYQKDGLEILNSATTNATPEEIEAIEKRGTVQIIHAIKQFKSFADDASAAIADPMTGKEDKAKYSQLKEAALFLAGDCWSRMSRPAEKLPAFRAQAAKAYEDYLAAYPVGKYSKVGYVKLGTIYTALGDMAKSKDALDRLSQKFPDSDEAKNAKPRLAKNLIEMGMKKEGAEIYSEMLHTDGSYTASQFVNAGEALIEAKSWDLANQAFEKAMKLAGTTQTVVIARSRIGQAKSAWKQGSLAEAREELDKFLADEKMSKMAIAADANFMLVEVASEQGRVEKDNAMRKKYFNAAIGALKKVRQYWRNKPQWEQDQLDLMSGDVLIDRMNAEESMGLKEEAKETCGRAASTFQVFLQAHGVTEEHPLEKMEPGAVRNLERAYATMLPLFTKLGAEQADRVMKFGQEYLDLFPNGKAKTEIVNCMNQAKADLPNKEQTK